MVAVNPLIVHDFIVVRLHFAYHARGIYRAHFVLNDTVWGDRPVAEGRVNRRDIRDLHTEFEATAARDGLLEGLALLGCPQTELVHTPGQAFCPTNGE